MKKLRIKSENAVTIDSKLSIWGKVLGLGMAFVLRPFLWWDSLGLLT